MEAPPRKLPPASCSCGRVPSDDVGRYTACRVPSLDRCGDERLHVHDRSAARRSCTEPTRSYFVM